MIKTLNKGTLLKILSNSDIKTLHESTLEILAEVGIRSDSTEILDLLSRGGADVDRKEGRVRFFPGLVEKCLKQVPENIKLCGRDPQKDIFLEKGSIFFGLGGSPEPYLKDPETGEIKHPTKQDMINTTRLGNALPNIDFIMSIAGSYDKPSESQYLHDLDALINNTDKPIICSAPGSQNSQYILEMTSSIVGKDRLISRCPIALVTASISPLVFTKMNEDIIEFAKYGIPIVFAPCPMIGATGPGTQIGTFIISNAETLAAVVLTQIIRPGTPIVYSANTTVMDMRTGRFSYGAPETTISRAITAQMAHFYRLPTFGQLAGGTDSMLCDAQAGAEVMMDSIICVLTGINLNQNYGTLAGGSTGSMEMAIISDEIIGMISRIVKGVKINHETLALDVIKEIGPSGNFLTHEHTLKWFKHELYEPKLFNRLSPEQWIKEGKKNVEQIASEKIRLLLEKSNNIVPHPEKAKTDLEEIILKAEKKFFSRSQS